MANLEIHHRSPTSTPHVMSTMDWAAFGLIILGGINWGLLGAFEFDPIATLFGNDSVAARVVYILIGLSSIYALYTASKLPSAE